MCILTVSGNVMSEVHGSFKMVKIRDSASQQIVQACCSQYLMSDCYWGFRVSRWAMREMMHRR